jgi:hypothetical protein
MRIVFAFVLILFLPCTLFAFWPFYWELQGQKNILGPLISYESEQGKTQVTVRPLLSSYDSPRTYSFLWPLGKSTEEKSYFIPLYMRHNYGDGRQDWAFFPFFYGKTRDRSYGGVFPFYGRLYERFRRDEIAFFLWPVYAYSRWEGTERTALLWPFFSFHSGRQEGYKIGPLYGERRVGDQRRSKFFLWPIFLKDEKDLDTEDPKTSLWAAPFYMQTTSPKSSFYAVFYPFFSYLKVEGRTDINAPWPFLYFSTGKEYRSKNVWPFYSHTVRGRDETTTVLWPVYRSAVKYPGENEKWTEKRFFHMSRYVVDDRGTFLNIWPLAEYHKEGKKEAFFFPAILPIRNPNFDRIVKPLITLYEYRGEENKRSSNLLYGLYTKEEEGETWKRRFAFLFEMKREPAGYGFQLLSGLFGIDAETIKILYLPISRVRAGETDKAEIDPDLSSNQVTE